MTDLAAISTEREAVLAPVYDAAKAKYDRRHSQQAAADLKTAATYLLRNELRLRAVAEGGQQ